MWTEGICLGESFEDSVKWRKVAVFFRESTMKGMVLEEFNASLVLNIGRSTEEERYRKKEAL
jgi:hypothetical protein